MSADYRVNHQIRAREVRLIDHKGVNHGVVPIQQAGELAEQAKLDLVEVAPNASPPVVRIMDYGKFTYEQTKREREARKHQKQIDINTLRFSPTTASFHRDISVKKARQWLEEGKKVKFVVKFRGRAITYPEIGKQLMEDIAKDLADISTVEQRPNLEGWSMVMLLAPEAVK